jgi:glycerol-3-phosphate dehydrogenase
MSTLGKRADILAGLGRGEDELDLLVIGGGITGAGILREAARQGLSALLVEQRDFAWGTSSRSSKMVHGGLRYIAQGDIALSRHSALERERLIAEAPGLVERMGYLFPIRKGQVPGRLLFGLLLTFYDRLAGIRTHGWHDAATVLALAPGLRAEGLKGASHYTDAITDDSRLVLRVLQQACKEGARVLNYARAQTLLRDDAGQVRGASLRDECSGESLDVHARVVINATGAWVDELREGVSGERTIRRLRGSHITVAAHKLPVQQALTLFHPRDRRATFIFPWEGFTVIGTTDLDHDETLDQEPGITRQELDYLLELVALEFPTAGLSDGDIVSSWAGVRPVISKDRSKDPSKERRDHQVWVDHGLVSVSGGKLTTFRLIARDTLRVARALLQGTASDSGDQRIFDPASITPATLGLQRDEAWALRLIGRYGDEAVPLLAQAAPGECAKIAGTAFCLAELRWSCRNEQVVHLDDLLLRRSRVGLLLAQGGEQIFPAIEAICQQELGWSAARWDEERQRYRRMWQHAYALPRS